MTTATMATTPERQTWAVRAFETLVDQTEARHLYFNGTELEMTDDVRAALDRMYVVVEFAPAGDLADLGKFHGRPVGHHLACDDDLLYPKDYAAVLRAAALRHPGAIITAHGVDLVRPFTSYYRCRNVYRCLRTVESDRPVDIGGTGVMLIPAGVRVRIEETWPYMADLLVARAARLDGITIVVAAHTEGWIKHQDIDHSKTIYAQHNRCDHFQTWYAARYLL